MSLHEAEPPEASGKPENPIPDRILMVLGQAFTDRESPPLRFALPLGGKISRRWHLRFANPRSAITAADPTLIEWKGTFDRGRIRAGDSSGRIGCSAAMLRPGADLKHRPECPSVGYRREVTMAGRDPAAYFAEAVYRLGHPGVSPAPEGTSARPFSIAFSREVGSGGTQIAQEVGRRLNWPVYDHELLERLAADLKVDVMQLESVDERPGSWLVECLKSFADVASVTEVKYFHRLIKMLLALGAQGECVIVGRGSVFVLPRETTLRVRVVADLEDRVALVQRERGLSAAEAAQYVASKDRERAKFVRDHFCKDLADPLNYDLVLNASRFSTDDCAALVLDALKLQQARAARSRSA